MNRMGMNTSKPCVSCCAQIRVNQEERQLTISGERRRAEAADGKNRRRSERRFGKFERKFKLPKDADLDAVTARYALLLMSSWHPSPFICCLAWLCNQSHTALLWCGRQTVSMRKVLGILRWYFCKLCQLPELLLPTDFSDA